MGRPILLTMAPSRTGVAPSCNIDDWEARSTMSLLVADKWKLAFPIKTKTTQATLTTENNNAGTRTIATRPPLPPPVPLPGLEQNIRFNIGLVYDDRKVNILTEDHVLRNHAALPLPYNQPI